MGRGFNKKKKHGDISWGDQLKHSFKVKKMGVVFKVNILGMCHPDEVGVLSQAINGSIKNAIGVLCVHMNNIKTNNELTKLTTWAEQYIDSKGWVYRLDGDTNNVTQVVEHLKILSKLCPSLNLKVTITDEEENIVDEVKRASQLLDYWSTANTKYEKETAIDETKKYYAISTIQVKDQIVTVSKPEELYIEWFTQKELEEIENNIIKNISFYKSDRLIVDEFNKKVYSQVQYDPEEMRIKKEQYRLMSQQHGKKI